MTVKPSAIDTNQFVLFHQKVNGIRQRDTGVDMLLNNSFITEWRVVQRQAIVMLQQASKQRLPDKHRRRAWLRHPLICRKDFHKFSRWEIDLTLSGIDNDINVATATERIRFAGQFVVVPSYAMCMAGVKLTREQQQFHLLYKVRKCDIQLMALFLIESTSYPGPVS